MGVEMRPGLRRGSGAPVYNERQRTTAGQTEIEAQTWESKPDI